MIVTKQWCWALVLGLSWSPEAIALHPELNYVKQRSAEFEQIPVERKERLDKLAQYVADRLKAHQPCRLTFI